MFPHGRNGFMYEPPEHLMPGAVNDQQGPYVKQVWHEPEDFRHVPTFEVTGQTLYFAY